MDDFGYLRAADTDTALKALATLPGARVVAGGTDMINLMKERIEAPQTLIDINRVGLSRIHADCRGLHLGALARMNAVLAHPTVRTTYPAIARALELSASPQLRNAATMGGNLLQRTRCPYFRAETLLPCNKRVHGSGCAAKDGHGRTLAVFGWSQECRATNPSDLAVALAALDAHVTLGNAHGQRTLPLTEFHLLPGRTPSRETALGADELLLSIRVPAPSADSRSGYLKVRERASYEFALVSVAATVELVGRGENTIIRRATLALGGVAAKPWRLRRTEEALVGAELTSRSIRLALADDFAEAQPLRDNAFKIELAQRAVVRTLLSLGDRA
ncbi:FAD binding domain-containing protein [Streptomyces sp. CA-132043]|uniref:FAD binding domain-containing protein n=1 Tax=Streptomyces sp. CA-132043 TaxID=3240048 RepID=UPI003D944667